MIKDPDDGKERKAQTSAAREAEISLQADAMSVAGPPEVGATGLTGTEAAKRLTQFGENALAEHHIGTFERVAHFFWGPIPWMIEMAAAFVAFFVGSAIKISTHRLLELCLPRQARHLRRVEGAIISPVPPSR